MNRMTKLIWLLAVLLLPGMVMATADLRLHGSNTVGAELAPTLVKAWLQSKGYGQIEEQVTSANERTIIGSKAGGESLTVELQTYGSSTSFKDMQAGSADIGMSSRPIKSSEISMLSTLGRFDSNRCEYIIGLDGIAIVVNQANPLTGLNKDQVRQIFAGEVTDWAKLGGAKGAIKLYALDDNSGTYDTFHNLVLGKNTPLAAGAERFIANEAVAKKVAEDANGIGFVGLPYAKGVKSLSIADGEAHSITPAPFTVATEDYVLARRLYFYAPEKDRNKMMSELLEFAVSEQGQAIVDKIGFVSQNIIASEMTLDDSVPAEYRDFAKGAQRLSVNFRFLQGTTSLDNKAHRDVERLKSFMSQAQYAKRYLMLFGFADGNEMPMQALTLSNDRADNVADLLIGEGMRPFRVRGFGSEVPIASNATETGRHKNRRVEVWLR